MSQENVACSGAREDGNRQYEDGFDYQRQKSLEGGRNSARLRVQRAAEPVREVIDLGDGSVIAVHDTFAEHRRGGRSTLVPADLVKQYPIVVGELPAHADGNAGVDGGGGDVGSSADGVVENLGFKVEGPLKGFKHQVLRAAKAAFKATGEDSSDGKRVVLPAEFEALGLTYRIRLVYWTAVLDERLDDKRADGKRAICDGVTDIDTAVNDSEIDSLSCVKRGANGGSASALASLEEGYGMVDLLSAIDSALERFSETDQYIFKQHFLEGREYQDIAAELGKANSSMTYAMKRVLPAVRQCLRDLGYGC